jgi:hypothetical protein
MSPILITGDIIIPEGITLTIEQEVIVQFKANYDDSQGGWDVTRSEIDVYGTLNINGKENRRILLTSDAGTKKQDDWLGIVFADTGATGNINYCSIEYPVYGMFSPVTSGPNSLRIDHCDIAYALWGFWLSNTSSVITNSYIHDCEMAFEFHENASTLMLNCVIYNIFYPNDDGTDRRNTIGGTVTDHSQLNMQGSYMIVTDNGFGKSGPALIECRRNAQAYIYQCSFMDGFMNQPPKEEDKPKPPLPKKANQSNLTLRESTILFLYSLKEWDLLTKNAIRTADSCSLNLLESNVIGPGAPGHTIPDLGVIYSGLSWTSTGECKVERTLIGGFRIGVYCEGPGLLDLGGSGLSEGNNEFIGWGDPDVDWNIYLDPAYPFTLKAENNWWLTTDYTAIDQWIYPSLISPLQVQNVSGNSITDWSQSFSGVVMDVVEIMSGLAINSRFLITYCTQYTLGCETGLLNEYATTVEGAGVAVGDSYRIRGTEELYSGEIDSIAGTTVTDTTKLDVWTPDMYKGDLIYLSGYDAGDQYVQSFFEIAGNTNSTVTVSGTLPAYDIGVIVGPYYRILEVPAIPGVDYVPILEQRRTYSVEGRVTNSGSGEARVKITAGHEVDFTDADGYYKLYSLEPGGYQIGFEKWGYTFNPWAIDIQLTNSDLTNQNSEVVVPPTPTPTPTPRYPRLTLSTNASSYARGEQLALNFTLIPSSVIGDNYVDPYIAVLLPSGNLVFYTGNGRWTSSGAPVYKGLMIGTTVSNTLGVFTLSSDLSSGEYTIYGVLNRPGKSVFKSNYWRSDLASTSFTLY